MSDDERAAVLAVITRLGGSITAGAGVLALGQAEMRFQDLGGQDSIVVIEGAIEPAIAVLFEIASAGRLVVVNVHAKCDEPVPVVTHAEALARASACESFYGAPELATDVDGFLLTLLPGHRSMLALTEQRKGHLEH